MTATSPSVRPGAATRPYDLLKEVVVAFVVVAVLTVGLAVVFSSPDVKPLTIREWARAAPIDFVTTANAELAGTSDTAQYGPPYTHTPGAAQKLGPISLQHAAGVRIPIDTARAFVLDPLSLQAPLLSDLRAALDRYGAASAARRAAWTDAYAAALDHASVRGGVPVVDAPTAGPVPVMLRRLYEMARSGALEGALLSGHQFYESDYTKPSLFLADGNYLATLASRQHLLGDQWGMMNETGRFPGQAWLWLYTFWYQVPPFSSSGNADALVWGVMAVLTLGLVLLPFIPGLRAIPERVPIYRIIWRDHYREVEGRPPRT